MSRDGLRRFGRATLVLLAFALAGAAICAAAPIPPPPRAVVRPGYAPAPGSRSWPIDTRLMEFSRAGDDAFRRSVREGIAFGDSLLAVGRASRDRTLRAAVHVWRGRKFANLYRLPDGMPDLDTAWTLSMALRDSAGLCRVLAARGHGATVLGRYEDSGREFRRLVPMARASGLPGLEGFAHRGLGQVDKLAGRYDAARRHFLAAIRLIPADKFEHRHSRFLLAEVKNRIGAHDEARRDFLALLDDARNRNDRWLEAACLNDLGILEYGEGDMAQADRWWAFAAAVFDSSGNVSSATASRINRAHALVHLGRNDEARALLESVRGDAERRGDASDRNATLTELGTLDANTGRPAQAERALRAVRAAEQDDLNENLAASSALAGLLRDTGRARESEALLDSMLAQGDAPLTPDVSADLFVQRSQTRRALGRPRDALADARAAERLARVGRRNGSIYWIDAAIELGRCHRAVGAPDSAVAVLAAAARTWERWRSDISDYQWRERQGSGLAYLFAEYGLALLDARRSAPAAARARQAFDALQVFQARTLEERMHGRGLAGSGMRVRVTADSLRRGVLREGELLVDLIATPDTTIAFLVSRRGLAVRLLPGTGTLDRLLADWRDVMLAGADRAVVNDGLRRLSAEMLASAAPALRDARRVIVTGGGPLALWPWSALTVPGESAPLCATRELYPAPSATLFAALRARAAGTGAPAVLALGRITDAAGRDLPGARRELEGLRNEYAGVVMRLNRGDRALTTLTADLSNWNVLHFAAHAQAEASTPWHSGFLLGAGAGEDAYLRASSIARSRLRADLAVLSGCQSAGATTLAGEGALGLASAFLCSGTRSVVATLWPVEDRVAQRFMAAFYDALADGRTVAGAVSAAQRVLRSQRETAEARDWAAFVATGEGRAQVRLTRRGALLGGRR